LNIQDFGNIEKVPLRVKAIKFIETKIYEI